MSYDRVTCLVGGEAVAQIAEINIALAELVLRDGPPPKMPDTVTGSLVAVSATHASSSTVDPHFTEVR